MGEAENGEVHNKQKDGTRALDELAKWQAEAAAKRELPRAPGERAPIEYDTDDEEHRPQERSERYDSVPPDASQIDFDAVPTGYSFEPNARYSFEADAAQVASAFGAMAQESEAEMPRYGLSGRAAAAQPQYSFDGPKQAEKARQRSAVYTIEPQF